MADPQKIEKRFGVMRGAKRIWAVASIHGQVDKLIALHEKLGAKLQPGDRVIYLGNVIGRGPDVRGTLDELLRFRCEVMAFDPAEAQHVFMLRGSQEEMWQKLLQLQFATDPRQVLEWMLGQGVDATLAAYGSSKKDALLEGRRGAMELTRWTNALRSSMQQTPGHWDFIGALRRAVYTEDEDGEKGLLFVNSGLDPSRPLEAQTDSFWWDSNRFTRISEPYGDFKKIVRGYDLMHAGLVEKDLTISIDGGCGFGGKLLCVGLTPEGVALELLEV